MFNSDQMQNYELNLRLRGGGIIKCEPGQIVSHLFEVDKLFHLTGAEYFRQGNEEDQISFSIVVNDLVRYEMAKDIFMGENGSYHFYKVTLQSGFNIRVTYKNNGASQSSFRYNLIMHEENA